MKTRPWDWALKSKMADEKEDKSSRSPHLVKKHHEKAEPCYSRPSYRDPRWEKAVKVYTINMESKYILVLGVPSLGVSKELRDIFSSYGNIESFKKLDEYPTEEFTEVYQIKYQRINNARYAKRKMDNKSFFGGILHICYAPEFETVDETREKLEERQRVVARKIKELYGINSEPQPNIKPLSSMSFPSDTRSQNIPLTTCLSGASTSTRTTETSSCITNRTDDFCCQLDMNYSEQPNMASPLIRNTQAPPTPNMASPLIRNTQAPPTPNMQPYSIPNTQAPPIPSTQTPSFPNIPPPPIPLHPSQLPPPPLPWELPRVPSANATLPHGLQNISNITEKPLYQHPSQLHSTGQQEQLYTRALSASTSNPSTGTPVYRPLPASQNPSNEPYHYHTASKSHGLPVPYEQNLGATNIQASGVESSLHGDNLQIMDASVDRTVQSIREKLKRVSSDSTLQGPPREFAKQGITKCHPQSKKQRKRI